MTEKNTTGKKNIILETALDLFAEHGFSHVSIAMIAKQSKVTKSLIFHHFANKETLWNEVKEAFFAKYAKHQMNLFEAEKEPLALIKKSMRYYFNFIQNNPKLAQFFAYANLENDELCGQLDQPLIEKGTQLIQQAQKDGIIRPGLNPVVVMMSFISMINQYHVARSRFKQWDADIYADPELFINNFIDLTIQGIKA